MRRILRLSNDFHNTAIRLIPQHGLLSVRQVKRARRYLCGIADCKCHGDFGERGPNAIQGTLDGERWIKMALELQPNGEVALRKQEGGGA